MKLTEEEIKQIVKLIKESSFDELQLEMGELKLVVRKGKGISPTCEESVLKPPAESTVSENLIMEVKRGKVRRARQKIRPETIAIVEEEFIPIKAPMLGTFYRRPEPGVPCYVEVGTPVKEDDTVCLIEVMKVFNAVKAGVQGYIHKVCAESGQLVEYGQTLFLVKPG